jgi:hypothetical protein
MSYVQEPWFVFCFLIVLFVYPFWKMTSGLRFSWFEIYLLVLMIVGVLLAAWRAQEVFGQPLMYGILGQRKMALIAVFLVLVNALNCGMVQLEDIRKALLSLAWGTFILYSAMQMFLTPSRFASYGVAFVTEPMPGEDASFKLQIYFILFGAFYYALVGMRTARKKYYLAAAILFFAAGLGTSRGFTISVVATLLFCLYRVRGLRKTAVAAAKFGCLAAIMVGVFYAIFPSAFSARVGHFSDAFTVVFTGSTTEDASANARIFETLTALPYIQEHPFLGNGVLSAQWQGGTQKVLGNYFYSDDIGIIGVVFSYGIVGLLLYAVQYWFAWKAAKALPDSFHTPLLDATKGIVLFSALYTLETGMCVWTAEVTFFFIALLGAFAAQTSSLRVYDAWNGEGCSLQKPALSL